MKGANRECISGEVSVAEGKRTVKENSLLVQYIEGRSCSKALHVRLASVYSKWHGTMYMHTLEIVSF